MFCYPCEQTAKGTGCTIQGVCGKQPEVACIAGPAALHTHGVVPGGGRGRTVGVSDRDVNVFTVKAAFSTLTNVDFDQERFVELVNQAAAKREDLRTTVQAAGGNAVWPDGPASFRPQFTVDALVAQGEKVGLKSYPGGNPDILSLKHTVLFGIKGVSAYADHALTLGQEDESVYAYVHEGLAAIHATIWAWMTG